MRYQIVGEKKMGDGFKRVAGSETAEDAATMAAALRQSGRYHAVQAWRMHKGRLAYSFFMLSASWDTAQKVAAELADAPAQAKKGEAKFQAGQRLERAQRDFYLAERDRIQSAGLTIDEQAYRHPFWDAYREGEFEQARVLLSDKLTEVEARKEAA